MAKAYEWIREHIGDKWYFTCSTNEHVPMIKCNPDGTFSVKDGNGKPRVEKNLRDAKKFAIEVYKKFTKFNKNFVK